MFRILYIEDDVVDQMVMRRELAETEHDLEIANNFDDARLMHNQKSFDLVISDCFVGPDNIREELHHWDSNKLIVLSNNVQLIDLDQIPCFEKPFRLEMLQGFIDQQKDRASTQQLNQLCGDDPEMMKQLLQMIEDELRDSINKLNDREAMNSQSKSAVLHKSLNKLGILGMHRARKKMLSYENKLREDEVLDENENEAIFSIFYEALNFVKQVSI